MIEILEIQARAGIQDLGRFGYRGYGIGCAGAMDKLALRVGNVLLANPEYSPAIEIALGGMRIKFHQEMSFCITGAFYEAYLGEKPVYSYWRYRAKAGQVLTLVRARIGMYGYLCLQGGLKLRPELGSCSTDPKARLGGLNGDYLVKNDQIPTARSTEEMGEIGIAPIELRNKIYAVPSTEYPAFRRKSQYAWWHSAWILQSQSDRMGLRFEGEKLELSEPKEMLSHAIQTGVVQVPPNGKPIILMADAQTTGGYPKIACILSSDLGRLAQIRFGQAVRFEAVTAEQAKILREKDEIYLNHIRRIVNEND